MVSTFDDYTINTNLRINDQNGDSTPLLLKIQKTILIFGKTGTGKSSVLNSITSRSLNLFKEGENNPNSTTSEIDAYIYKLFSKENTLSCLFIDTPGLFDSNEKDKENIIKISRFVEKSGFSIILFTHSILETKIDTTFTFVLDLLIEIFGENVMERVFFILTHLNSLKENLINSKIDYFKNNFNTIVTKNKNDLLFYDYNNIEQNYNLTCIEEKLSKFTTLMYPSSKQEKLRINLLNTKSHSLELVKKNLLQEFEMKNEKFINLKKDKETEYQIKLNNFQTEVSKLETDGLVKSNNFLQSKQLELNNFVTSKQLEYNTFQTNKINVINQKQRDFYTYGGSIINNNYTISGNNTQILFDIFNSIGKIEIEIKTRLETINSEIKNREILINNEIKTFENNKSIALTTFLNEKNVTLNNFKKDLENIVKNEFEKLNLEKDKTNSELQNIQKDVNEVILELNFLSEKKYNVNYNITYYFDKNLCKVNNIEINDNFQFTDIDSFKTNTISNYSTKLNAKFDVEYSKNYYLFEKEGKMAIFKENSKNEDYLDYHLYPVARLDKLLTKSFLVKLHFRSYGWFGIGSKELIADGFSRVYSIRLDD